MSWGDWSYIKKGAVAGEVFGIIIILFWSTIGCGPTGFLGGGGCNNDVQGTISFIMMIIYMITSFPLMFLTSWIKALDTNLILGLITSLIYYLLLGALIGYIFGKFKNKN